MFDELVSPFCIQRKQGQKRWACSAHYTTFCILMLLFVITVSSAVVMLLITLSSDKSFAQEGEVDLHIVSHGDEQIVVPPLTLYTLLEVEARVDRAQTVLQHVELTLKGRYDYEDIDRIVLFVDGVQVGQPALLNTGGTITFLLDSVLLMRGVHRIAVKITAQHVRMGTMFQLFVQPTSSFSFSDGIHALDYSVLQPFGGALVRVVPHGELGGFMFSTQTSQEQMLSPQLYLYAHGEDMYTEKLIFESNKDLTGSRIDIFRDNDFVTAAPFEDTRAVAVFDSYIVRVLRARNTHLSIQLHGPAFTTGVEHGPMVSLVHAQVSGITSHRTWEQLLTLQIL